METILTAAVIIAIPAAFFSFRRYMPRHERKSLIEQSILEMLFHSKHPMPEEMIFRRIKKAGLGDITWGEFRPRLEKVSRNSLEVFSWRSANSGFAHRVYQHTAFCDEMDRLVDMERLAA